MRTMSLKLSDYDDELIREYVSINNLTLSAFARESMLDRIEEDLALDEARIRKALKEIDEGKTYPIEEVWKEMGI